MIFNALYILTGSLVLSSASPLGVEPRATQLACTTIEAIDPRTKVCDPKQEKLAQECRTAEQAVGSINKSFQKYQLTTPGEQAAALAWMLYESGGFKYHHNLDASAVGKGTRNQQSATFNLEYAKTLQGGSGGGDLAQVTQANVIDKLLPDDYSFGSAAWFISAHSQTCRQGLKAGSLDGWNTFLTSCVGTNATEPGRKELWSAAMTALPK